MTNDTTPPWRNSIELLNSPVPETEWLVEGVLPKESITLFSGREGSLKTWLAQDWAYHVAEGIPWLGRECEASAVLYLDAENPRQVFVTRLQAIGGSRNLNTWRWQDETFPPDLNHPNLLLASQHHDLIIVDSLRRFMKDFDENDATEMSRITAGLRTLTQGGAAVVAIHHSPKDATKRGYRGSTELGAGVDVCMSVSVEHQAGIKCLSLSTEKTRYHETPLITLEVEKTEQRPIFREIGASQTTAGGSSTFELDRLSAVIRTLQTQLGSRPTQTQIITEANQQGLGSRNTILQRLREGEGGWWHSEPDGRSRVYEPVHVSNLEDAGLVDNNDTESDRSVQPVQLSDPMPTGQMDNSASEPVQSVHPSNPGGVGQLDNSPSGPVQPIQLSNPIGTGQMDNSSPTSVEPVQLSTLVGVGQVDNTNVEPSQLVQLSNSLDIDQLDNKILPPAETLEWSSYQVLGEVDQSQPEASPLDLSNCPGPPYRDRLDNRTGPTEGTGNPTSDLHLVGESVWFMDQAGQSHTATVQEVIEWPGLPEEITYRLAGHLVPPSQLK